MSSIKLKHSGGNSVSLNPPTSAPTSSEVAFKLPNADGSAGQLLKTDGSGNLGFIASAVGGKVLQVVSTSSTTSVTVSSGVTALLNVSITPASASNQILLLSSLGVYIQANSNCFAEAHLYRGDTSGTSIFNQRGGYNGGTNSNANFGFMLVDSPNTTSAQTYTMGFSKGSSNTTSVTTDNKYYSLIAVELAA